MSATNGNDVGVGDEPMDQEDPAEAEPSAEYNNSAPVAPPDGPSNSSNGKSISRNALVVVVVVEFSSNQLQILGFFYFVSVGAAENVLVEMLHHVTVKEEEEEGSQQKLLDQYELREYQVKYETLEVKMI
jgi:hypothetical protein